METEILVTQQEETTAEENAPTLQPWSTPRLQYLNSHDAAKVLWVSESFLPPTSGPS